MESTEEAKFEFNKISANSIGKIILFFAIMSLIFPIRAGSDTTKDFFYGIRVEVVGIALGVLLIDRANRQRAIDEQKAELILQMGSPERGFAVTAARSLKVKGWLQDGSLRKANLGEADLTGADLDGANLEFVCLNQANLKNTYLWNGSLKGADLTRANLEGSRLEGLESKGTIYKNTLFDEFTTLPDGTKWSTATDMKMFTDPNHVNFWRSIHKRSPANKGLSRGKSFDS